MGHGGHERLSTDKRDLVSDGPLVQVPLSRILPSESHSFNCPFLFPVALHDLSSPPVGAKLCKKVPLWPLLKGGFSACPRD